MIQQSTSLRFAPIKSEMDPYKIIPFEGREVPIVVSVPHCGVTFPDEIKNQYKPSLVEAPDDTDWFVDQLYNFAPSMGITMISAVYSRWVIDLNRDPESKPLYSDGRIITGLCPTTTFLGEPLYRDERKEIDQAEVNRRLEKYYHPYHRKIQELLSDRKSRFGRVLLWDCHSIREYVKTIQQEKFPDLILGDADGNSSASELINVTLQTLRTASYSVNHNHPFKGGTITRTFGRPAENQHALQLEMSKVKYMDDSETRYDSERAEKMRELLKRTLTNLADQLLR